MKKWNYFDANCWYQIFYINDWVSKFSVPNFLTHVCEQIERIKLSQKVFYHYSNFFKLMSRLLKIDDKAILRYF